MNTTARFYFDIEGDDEALKEGFDWLFAHALGGRAVVAVPGLRQVDNLVPGLSPWVHLFNLPANRLDSSTRLSLCIPRDP